MTQRYFDLRRSIYLNTNSFMKYVWEHTQTPVNIGCLQGELGGANLELGNTCLYVPVFMSNLEPCECLTYSKIE